MNSDSKTKSYVLAVILIVTGISMMVYFGIFADRDNPEDNNGEEEATVAELTDEERLDIYRRIRQANAALEDEEETVVKRDGKLVSGYDFAEQAYEELAKQLPSEILPIANLAISKFVYATKTSFSTENFENPRQAKDDAYDAARSALQKWRKAAPDSAAPFYLTGRLIQAERNQFDSEVLSYFEQAVERDPANPILQYQYYQASTFSNAEDAAEKGEQALLDAFDSEPDNFAIAMEMARRLANDKSDRLLPLLESLRTDISAVANQDRIVGDIADSVKRLDAIVDKLKAGEWERVDSETTMLTNLVKNSEGFRSDMSRLNPDGLDFVHQTPSDEFMSALGAAADSQSPPIEVTFQPSPAATLTFDSPVRELQLADMDLDGIPELVVLTADAIIVYQTLAESDAPIERFRFAIQGDYSGMLIADLDQDLQASSATTRQALAATTEEEKQAAIQAGCDEADADVLLWGKDGLLVLRNNLLDDQLTREFQADEPSELFQELTDIQAALLVDIEQDADLDVIVARPDEIRIMLHLGAAIGNNKPVEFKDHSRYSLLPKVTSPISTLQLVDWDRDVDPDILIADREGNTVGYLEGLRHGRFQWRRFSDELPDFTGKGPLRFLEADGNASWDLVGLDDGKAQVALTSTTRANVVQPMRDLSFDASWNDFLITDFDNDGNHDLIGWNDAGLSAVRGRLDGSFVEASDLLPEGLAGVTSATRGDLDVDGDLDLVIARGNQVEFLINEGGNKNHWFTLRSFGQEDNAGRSNHNGIGSLIEVRSGLRYQAQMMEVQRNHFGLGPNQMPDVVRTIWTNGMPQGIIELKRDTTICQKMYLKGSCPFVYTWTGERYEFLTDCLWAAPIGLQQAEGKVAPSRSWEYLKIPGERLQPIDGEYRIQLTEELWEAAYFDQVELICIDHPADVDIFSNEKVGPPSIAQYKVHTVSNPHHPVAASDQFGRDVLSTIIARDEVYFRGFDRKIRQGLTPPHHLEIDLGEIDRSQTMTLFLTGWIHPTDTSLNVAFSQNPGLDAPRLPELWVADGAGEWRAVPNPIGFPGGKTKTIAVDLTGVFPTDDCRLQLRSSAEVYWDEVFFTVGEPEAPVQTTKLTVAAADLHYRGFSKRFTQRPNGPELFDYSTLETTPQWPPMRGKFTRYGDVTELLTEEDDCMAILAAGDEMTVRFLVPETTLPAGWKRDFFLHSVGWDKDADLNTIHGQTVEPLPHRQMTQYPYAPENGYPDSPKHRRYLEQYQTRESDFGKFWHLLSSPLSSPSREDRAKSPLETLSR